MQQKEPSKLFLIVQTLKEEKRATWKGLKGSLTSPKGTPEGLIKFYLGRVASTVTAEAVVHFSAKSSSMKKWTNPWLRRHVIDQSVAHRSLVAHMWAFPINCFWVRNVLLRSCCGFGPVFNLAALGAITFYTGRCLDAFIPFVRGNVSFLLWCANQLTETQTYPTRLSSPWGRLTGETDEQERLRLCMKKKLIRGLWVGVSDESQTRRSTSLTTGGRAAPVLLLYQSPLGLTDRPGLRTH